MNGSVCFFCVCVCFEFVFEKKYKDERSNRKRHEKLRLWKTVAKQNLLCMMWTVSMCCFVSGLDPAVQFWVGAITLNTRLCSALSGHPDTYKARLCNNLKTMRITDQQHSFDAWNEKSAYFKANILLLQKENQTHSSRDNVSVKINKVKRGSVQTSRSAANLIISRAVFIRVLLHLSIRRAWRSIPARWAIEESLGKGGFHGNLCTPNHSPPLHCFTLACGDGFHTAAPKEISYWVVTMEYRKRSLMHGTGTAEVTAVTSSSWERRRFLVEWRGKMCVGVWGWRDPSVAALTSSLVKSFDSQTLSLC